MFNTLVQIVSTYFANMLVYIQFEFVNLKALELLLLSQWIYKKQQIKTKDVVIQSITFGWLRGLHWTTDLMFYLLGFGCFAFVKGTTILFVWSNWNQSNVRSFVQQYFPFWDKLVFSALFDASINLSFDGVRTHGKLNR